MSYNGWRNWATWLECGQECGQECGLECGLECRKKSAAP